MIYQKVVIQGRGNKREMKQKMKSKVAAINKTISITTLNVNGLKILVKGRDYHTG